MKGLRGNIQISDEEKKTNATKTVVFRAIDVRKESVTSDVDTEK